MAKTRRKSKPVTLPPGFNGDIDLQMVDVLTSPNLKTHFSIFLKRKINPHEILKIPCLPR